MVNGKLDNDFNNEGVESETITNSDKLLPNHFETETK